MWQAQRATREAQRARIQREWSEVLFNETFDELPPEARLRVIERADAKARELLAGHPDLLANCLDMLASRSLEAGKADRAAAYVLEALSLRKRTLAETDEDIIESLFNTALIAQNQYEFERAIELYEQVERYYTGLDMSADANALVSAHNRALCLLELSRDDEALELLNETIATQIATYGENDPNTLTFQNTLARWQVEHGQLAQGRMMLERIVALRRAHPDDFDEDSLAWVTNLADAYRRSNDCVRAIEAFEQVQAERTRKEGERHPLTLSSVQNTAATMIQCGKAAGAKALLASHVPVFEEELGPEHPETVRLFLHLSAACRETSDWDAADASARTVIERGTNAGETELVASAQWVLGVSLQGRERWDESEAPLLESWTHYGQRHSRLVESLGRLADHYAANDRMPDAERLRALTAKQ
jgi:tetratricopeptide (TPR) repeat protein